MQLYESSLLTSLLVPRTIEPFGSLADVAAAVRAGDTVAPGLGTCTAGQ